MVSAAPLSDKLIEARRLKMAEKAVELKLIAADDPSRIRFYDGNKLARWMSLFPALAVSRLTAGPGSVAVDFDTWQSRQPFVEFRWVTNADREDYMRALREQALGKTIMRARVQGESGIGKTRMVLEALRNDSLRHLVAYVHDASEVSGELLAHLTSGGRAAILIVDECPPEKHYKLIEQLPADPSIKLVTIGPDGPAVSRNPVILVRRMAEEDVGRFLEENYYELGSEAHRFVIDHSRGNIQWAIVLADRVVGAQDAQAADLIARNDITNFVARLLPEGADFFYSTVLALFERIGWDREISGELETVAHFAQTSVEQLRRVGLELEQRGFVERQGRYRAVAPHPLAVFLAAEGWRSTGDRIMDELLPTLSEDMALSLFTRVADLGRFEPARSVLPRLLSPRGPFASLESIGSRSLGRQLTQLAIVLPDEVALHLSELISDASIGDLRVLTGPRRDLVWTLEKLVWHRRTFETAATALLRLALAENENYANNATATWLGLFSTVIPATAATPDERIRYLTAVTANERKEIRHYACRAAAQALLHHELAFVSGELQRGVLVEPRGTPATTGDADAYRRAAIDVLTIMVNDQDPEISSSAGDLLIKALHPVTAMGASVFEALSNVLVRLTGDPLQDLRTEAEQLRSLYDHRSDDDDQVTLSRINSLLARLPAPTALEQLAMLLKVRRWDYADGELAARFEEQIRLLVADDHESAVFGLLEQEQANAWEMGRALAITLGEATETLDRLVSLRESNASALVGYLAGLVETGHSDAFERFLASDTGTSLNPIDRVQIAVRGPASDHVRQAVLRDLHDSPLIAGVGALFGWFANIQPEDATSLLDDWSERLASQRDYNALVEWVFLQFHTWQDIPAQVHDKVTALLLRRSEYPEVSRQLTGWAHLAELQAEKHGVDIFGMLLTLLDSDAIRVHEQSADARVLIRCARANPTRTWETLVNYLTAGSWRVVLSVARWLIDAFSADVIADWIDHNLIRARAVSLIASTGGEEPSPVARLLLADFWQDKDVSSRLAGAYVSGTWWGDESARISRQIDQLSAWRANQAEPLGVRTWARDLAASLAETRERVLEREAEERP